MNDKLTGLEGYLKILRKALKTAKHDFWKEMKIADEAFHKEIVIGMRDYEKVEYSSKRVPGALVEANNIFNERYKSAYEALGRTTKEALERFEKRIEDLIGV